MVENPYLDILHGYSNQFICIDSFTPIPLKIGPLGPYIGPNVPRGGIFALDNMCFHKPGSDRELWVPLKFCHQGGAWGPLLPTRLQLYLQMPKMDGTKVNVVVDIKNNIDKNQHRGFIILLLLSRFGDNWCEGIICCNWLIIILYSLKWEHLFAFHMIINYVRLSILGRY